MSPGNTLNEPVPNPIEDVTRRGLLVAPLAAALFAACRSDDEERAAAPTAVPAMPTATESAKPFAGTVVDLGDSLFDLAQMGVPVKGNIYGSQFLAAVLDHVDGIAPEVRAGVLAGQTMTAARFELNVEAVAALRPDLVLITDQFTRLFGTGFERVQALAPVTVIPDAAPWQERTRAIATAVGRLDAANERIARVEERFRRLKSRAQAAGRAGTRVGVLRPFQEQVLAFIQPSLASQIIAEVGLTQPSAQLAQQPPDSPFPGYAAQIFVSLGRLGDFDGDVRVVPSLDTKADPLKAFAPAAPVQSLRAVRAGTVYAVKRGPRRVRTEEDASMNLVIRQHDGGQLDHIAWAMADFDALCRQFEAITGIAPAVPAADQGSIKSAAVHLGGEQTLELLACTPGYQGPTDPMAQMLAAIQEPRLLFWYVAVTDFDAFAEQVQAAGLTMSHVAQIDVGVGRRHEFKRGAIAELMFRAPFVIQWIHRAHPAERLPGGATIEDFAVLDPEPDTLRATLAALGITLRIEHAETLGLRLTLRTPRGRVTLN